MFILIIPMVHFLDDIFSDFAGLSVDTASLLDVGPPVLQAFLGQVESAHQGPVFLTHDRALCVAHTKSETSPE